MLKVSLKCYRNGSKSPHRCLRTQTIVLMRGIEWHISPKSASFSEGPGRPSNAWFLLPTRVCPPNDSRFAQCTGVPNTQTTMLCMRCAPCPTTMISETNQLPNALKQQISKFCPQVNTSIQYLFGSVKLLEYCRVEAATEFVFISVHCVPIRNTCTAYTFMSACENVNSAN